MSDERTGGGPDDRAPERGDGGEPRPDSVRAEDEGAPPNDRGKDSVRGKEPVRLRDHEPLLTIRAHPRRFWIGLPTVFFGGMAAGLVFVEQSLALAILVQLTLQTAGFLWLYLPVALERWRREEGGERSSGPSEGSMGRREKEW